MSVFRLHIPRTVKVALLFNQNVGPYTLLPSAGQTDLGNNLRLGVDTFKLTLP